MEQVPVIDVSAWVHAPGASPASAAERSAARQLDRACRDLGFVLISGHGVDPHLLEDLDHAARRFFALDDETKSAIAMAKGGRAWRGWFPEGGELTAGQRDHKEGVYFGAEVADDDPRVVAGQPLHGANQFPAEPAELEPLVLRWMAEMTRLGHALARGAALALELEPDWFHRHLTADPTILFRIFRYPPRPPDQGWGVAEHTDYGLLTILAHDGTPGLQVRAPSGWIDVPAVPDTFVVNLGDMLERMTAGRWRSTPHRVRNQATEGNEPNRPEHDRVSYPFFFDPGWDAEIRPVPGLGDGGATMDPAGRWDGADVHQWSGTYGDYLTAKVAKVFPALGRDVLN